MEKRSFQRTRLVCTLIALLFGAEAGLAATRAHAAGCGPAPPLKEPTEEARQTYQTAMDLVDNGRFSEALAAFQRAYDQSPSYVILYNLAKAAALSSDPARALHAFECHLEHGGSAIAPGQHSEVTAEIARLRGEVGLVAVEVDELAASIDIDGTAVGTSPLDAPVVVNPGTRLVRVRGSKTESRAIEVGKGARIVVKFDLDSTPVEKPGARFRFPGAVVGISWVVAGLLGVSTAVTGTLALVGDKDIENDVYLGPAFLPPRGSDLDDKLQRTRAFATATDVLLTAFTLTGAAAISFSVVNAVNKDDGAAAPPKASVSAFPGGLLFTAELP